MDFTRPAVMRYLEELEASSDEVLLAMESRAAKDGFPIIGPLVGRTCAVLARAIDARRVFEMGSGYGYSTLHFARAVGPDGRIVHTDGDARLSTDAKGYATKAGVAARIEFRVGDALELLRRDTTTYDVVFIDVDKHQYPDAFRIAQSKVRVGGCVLVDNALWMGKVADPAITDRDTQGVRTMNELAMADPKWMSTVLPLRDGLLVALRVA